PLQRGAGDPTQLRAPDGALWRTARTPDGPGTLRLHRSGEVVHAQCWGPGARWLADRVPDLLGADDDPGDFVAHHPVVAATLRRLGPLRLPRLGLVFELVVPSVLEQRVTGAEARRSWRTLVRRYGEPAPGPAPGG